ncbi:DEAD/DEAH box helicase [Fusibacter ferrireducens]|nr:DEAD/DEAH box helicase [Fusibacter ferrireducens]
MNNFETLGLDPLWSDKLKKIGITIPTAIQNIAIPEVLNQRNVIAEAQTGSGKTLAFLLPILQNIDALSSTVQALVLVPTRELAIQITEEAKKITGDLSINVLSIYGGQDLQSQLKKLNHSVHMIIATPGRLIDHLDRKTIDLSKVKTFVLDEADQMLVMGFRNDIDKIVYLGKFKAQVLCFSATIDAKVKKLAYKYMENPLILSAHSDSKPLDVIEQRVIMVSDRWKMEALLKTLDETNPFLGIIFCRTKIRADKLETEMKRLKYTCEKLHSDISQNKRQRIMRQFKDAKFQYLITTDVASRGIDVTGITHIYNYDMPESVEIYVHRIGRTGRMGEDGIAITFVTPRDEEMLKAIEERLKVTISQSFHEHQK